MGAPVLLRELEGRGLKLWAEGGRLLVSPKKRITDDARALIRAHRAELFAALDHGAPGATGPALRPAPTKGADCMRCANLTMRCEVHEPTRRVFWWRCERGYELLEGRNFGERVMLAPPECDAAGAFEPWTARSESR